MPTTTCNACQYDLAGIKSLRCPECGTPLPTDIPSPRFPSIAYKPRAQRDLRTHWHSLLTVLLTAGVLALIFVLAISGSDPQSPVIIIFSLPVLAISIITIVLQLFRYYYVRHDSVLDTSFAVFSMMLNAGIAILFGVLVALVL